MLIVAVFGRRGVRQLAQRRLFVFRSGFTVEFWSRLERRQFELILNPVFPGSVVQNPFWILSEALSTPVKPVVTPLVLFGITVDRLPAFRNGRGDAFYHFTVRIGLLMPVAGVFAGCIPRFALLHATGAEVRGARLCPEF